MCKIAIVTGNLRPHQVMRAVNTANVCFANTQRDGFGFLAADSRHKERVAIGRYLDPNLFPGWGVKFPEALSTESAETGVVPDSTNVLLIHGRTGTGGNGLDCVHPFTELGSSLIHNGKVTHNGKGETPKVACDSHQLLVWMMEQITNGNQTPWDDMRGNWGGWGVVAFYNSPTGILSVMRDGATLFIAKRKGNLGHVFATSETDLERITSVAGIAIEGKPILFTDNRLIQIEAGKVGYCGHWQGFGSLNTYNGGHFSSNHYPDSAARQKAKQGECATGCLDYTGPNHRPVNPVFNDTVVLD